MLKFIYILNFSWTIFYFIWKIRKSQGILKFTFCDNSVNVFSASSERRRGSVIQRSVPESRARRRVASRRAEKRLTFVNNSPQHNYESPQPGSCKSLARPRLFFSLSSLASISRAHQTEAGCPSHTRPSSRFLILFWSPRSSSFINSNSNLYC